MQRQRWQTTNWRCAVVTHVGEVSPRDQPLPVVHGGNTGVQSVLPVFTSAAKKLGTLLARLHNGEPVWPW
jgi:hypothetical protein